VMAGPAPRRLRSAGTSRSYIITIELDSRHRRAKQRVANATCFGELMRRRYIVYLLHTPGHTINLPL